MASELEEALETLIVNYSDTTSFTELKFDNNVPMYAYAGYAAFVKVWGGIPISELDKA